MLRVLLFYFLINIGLTISEFSNLRKIYEDQLSFRSPINILADTNEIPFFEIGGHVIPGKDRVRLTTSLPDQQGWIWSKNSLSFDGFQVDIDFTISGSDTIGADGFAVWVVQNKSNGGSALGSSNNWKGLGIFFDTYDNDGDGNNPIIMGIINDGTKYYDSNSDGKDITIGSCTRNYRNKQKPVHARIAYFNESLEVLLSSSNESPDLELEQCFKTNVNLPLENYYFGLSAATGTLADDHDIELFEVHRLSDYSNINHDELQQMNQNKDNEKDLQSGLDNLINSERKNISENFTRSDYQKINKNLILLWQEIIRQNIVLKLILNSTEAFRKSQVSQVHKQDQTDLISQIEFLRKEFIGTKTSIDYLSQKIENPSNSYQHQQALNQLRDEINSLKISMAKEIEKNAELQNNIYQNQEKVQVTLNYLSKECGSCISTFLMVIIGLIQVLSIVGYMIYQKNKENSVKKFY